MKNGLKILAMSTLLTGNFLVLATPVPEANSPQQATSAGANIPAGTVITVRTVDPIDSQKAQAGQTFRASLDEPIVANNQTVVVKGSDVLLKLLAVKQSGKITGSAELTVAVDSVMINGNRIALSTEGVTSASGGRGQKSAKVIGGTAAVGAVLGGIFGGVKGAAAGGAAGAGAGTAVQLVTKGQHVVIPSESRLSFSVSTTDTEAVKEAVGGAQQTSPPLQMSQPTSPRNALSQPGTTATPAKRIEQASPAAPGQQQVSGEQKTSGQSTTAATASVGGIWNMSRRDGESTITETLTIQQNGGTIKGTLEGNDLIRSYKLPLDGTVSGDQIAFTVPFNNGKRSFVGTVHGESISSSDSNQWSAMRPIARGRKR
jgi:hypothetical protein